MIVNLTTAKVSMLLGAVLPHDAQLQLATVVRRYHPPSISGCCTPSLYPSVPIPGEFVLQTSPRSANTMRLLKISGDGNFSLVKFIGLEIPPYAILSHTWETGDQELTFQDMIRGTGRYKAGYKKIQFCEEQAKKDNFQYLWVDTCCIDKSSSAELSEAINSMFRWYKLAAKCYVYLSDVSISNSDQSEHYSRSGWESAFRQSRWFTRGWTLQELLAAPSVDFYSREGKWLGDKKSLELDIHELSGIAITALQGAPLSQFSVTERMLWAANRETTIEEDRAYCLLGIFDVHFPQIYGEGAESAFRRLRKEIAIFSGKKLEPDSLIKATDISAEPRDPPRLTDASAAEKTEACLANLTATDQTRFLTQTLIRSKNACAWILNNQKFVRWYDDDISALLWITAKAGYGKTTLAAHISQMISANPSFEAQIPQKNESKPLVLFFFFQRSNQEAEKTAIAALRTLASQLVRQEPQVLPILLKRHDFLSAKGAFEWSWENLSGVLVEMLEHVPLSSCVYILLDAVDECEATSRGIILDWVKRLVEETATILALKRSRPVFKVLVTSRPDGDIFDQLSRFPTIDVVSANTQTDMQALIRGCVDELARLRHLNPLVVQSIINFLESNAHGMFLWVVLIIKELEKRDERLTDEVISSKLSRIPLTLVATYEDILHNTPPTRKNDMWRILRWLLFGTRVLTLAELESAICLETSVSNWHDFVGDVKFLCGSFIRFNGVRGEIDFVHQTARSFLEAVASNSSSEDLAGVTMDTKTANEHLATVCVQYLLQTDFQQFSWLWARIRSHSSYVDMVVSFLRTCPFLQYAIQSWATHIRAIGTPSNSLVAMICLLLKPQKQRDGIMALTYFIKFQGSWAVPTSQTSLHLAAYFDFPWLVDLYIAQDQASVNEVSQMNDTPLIWASEKGSTECVKKLLDAGADPNKFEFDGWSALHWASRNGHLDVVVLLLERGARLDPRDRKGHTPLDWAVDREHWEVVGVLHDHVSKCENATHPSGQKRLAIRPGVNLGSHTPGSLFDFRP